MPVGNWIFPFNNTEPIEYVWIETYSMDHEGTIAMYFREDYQWLDYDTGQYGYDFQFYTDYGNDYLDYLRIDYVRCFPELPIQEYDYKIKWTDLSVTFHKFGEVANAPRDNLRMLDIAVFDYNRFSWYECYTPYLDYDEEWDLDYQDSGYFLRDDGDIYEDMPYSAEESYITWFGLETRYGSNLYISTVDADGQTISSYTYDDWTDIGVDGGFTNLLIQVSNMAP